MFSEQDIEVRTLGNGIVTWLLPVKNGMPYLPETLASIESQTYQNWSILAWDNGSTDTTVEVLREWIPARLPGRIIVDRPLGLGACLAEMVKECQSEFCVRIDADDVNLPDRLEKEVTFLKEHPEVAVVGAATQRIDAQGVNHGIYHQPPMRHSDIVLSFLQRNYNPLSHPTALFRRSAVLDVGNYRNVGEINIEDYDLWLRMAHHYQLANLPDVLLLYRVHNTSSTQIAQVQSKLTPALDRRFNEHAPSLYGCSEGDLQLLRERRHPSAKSALGRIASHLQKKQGGAPSEILHSDGFLNACAGLISGKDIISRLWLARLRHRFSAIPSALLEISKDMVSAIVRKAAHYLERRQRKTT